MNVYDLENYYYPLPKERIAKYPLPQRDHAKLLIYRKGDIEEDRFYNLAEYLPEKTMMVLNQTKVIPARLFFFTPTGARIEIFCVEPFGQSIETGLQSRSPSVWKVLIGNQRRWKVPVLKIENECCQLFVRRVASQQVEFFWEPPQKTFLEVLQTFAQMPIPPYLKRSAEAIDKERYQTTYAKIAGSVAAPTAGLHFTPELLGKLKQKFSITFLTLHVGIGTFKPIKSKDIREHTMHEEYFSVSKDFLYHLYERLEAGPIAVVGTTSLRALESLYWIGLQSWEKKRLITALSQSYPQKTSPCLTPKQALEVVMNYLEKARVSEFHAKTALYILPGFPFQYSDMLITNFHQPYSSLLVLVHAFIGEDWRKVYDYALKHSFRFLSYGDSSLLYGSHFSY